MRGLSLIAVLAVIAVAQGANDGREYIHRRMLVSPSAKDIPHIKPAPKVAAGNCGVAPLGDSGTANPKIVGGAEVAPPHSYPWQAALYIDFLYFCGGSLISNEWVLTAAHCLHNANRARIVLGAHDLSASEASQLELLSTTLTVHESYSSITIHNDIALARLPELVTFNDFIQPVCLPSRSDVALPAGTIVTPTGWGLTSDTSSSISNTLNFVNVPVVEQQTCVDYYGNLVVYDGNVCIDSTGGHGTCSGDSGGPLNYVPVAGGPTFTRGITSYGSSAGCESGAPDAFTRIIYFLDWIETNTGIVIDP